MLIIHSNRLATRAWHCVRGQHFNSHLPRRSRLGAPRSPGPQSVQGFLHDVLGSSWQDFVPPSWTAPSFDWSILGGFGEGASVTRGSTKEFNGGAACKPALAIERFSSVRPRREELQRRSRLGAQLQWVLLLAPTP